MAVDIFKETMNNQQLIEAYEGIGNKRLENKEYKLTEHEIYVVSAISKRKLTHRTKFKYGLPSKHNEGRY
ncbi:hypothetical protein FKN04_12765 [Bacillus glycinifermentans]|uniref:hypothetical protein n=1 Tax=Bacillus glycinifermentans TaxID=1664069 RepID=UPI001582FD67|nr:hypothetical protein [Bacillus glycinifermentans]NUJ17447.1 hypothetical protein [Bacillus glycinifermentans]